ncbi:MAG: Sjogren's syndrome/scleroderma autoantigen 1 family protein [Salinirussus sp.]
MPDRMHVIAGRCHTEFDGASRTRDQYGDALVLVKPDGTVLVHDADGYQPVAWLTRPEATTVTDGAVTAQDGGQSLRVGIEETYARGRHPAGAVGTPVADCPDCGTPLVRARGTVTCPGCGERYGLPADAAVVEERCDCGLPRLRVRRGEEFTVCIDRDCEALDERVRERFDGAFGCPDCDGDLRVLRRGGLLFGCENYPDCETGFAVPRGVHDGTCDCGLPAFRTDEGRRCLDGSCDRRRTETARS